MIELLLLGVIALAALCALVALSLLLIGALFKVLLFVILLPFKILQAAFGLLAGILAGAGKVALVLIALVGGGLLAAGALLVLPFLPVLLLVGAVWLVARLFRPRPALNLDQDPR